MTRTLKSVTAQPQTELYSRLQAPTDWDSPPRDGTALADVYAWEEARLTAMRNDRCAPIIYGWVPARSISLSRREAVKLGVSDRLTLDGFTSEPLAIRGTGGTAVPQGPGTMNITFFTRHADHPGITEFYHEMCAALQTSFERLSISTTIGACPGSFCDGDFNLLSHGKKLVGTAQRWCRARNGDTIGVHHAVVLTGATPTELCDRLHRLYRTAGIGVRYDPSVHSEPFIDVDDLREAMAGPLSALIA